MASGRTSLISQPEFAQAVAQAYVDGMNRQEMADEFNVSPGTITTWTKDPRIVTRAAKLTQDRVLRITRKIDNEIDQRLEEVDEMDIELMLKIRKEFLSKALVMPEEKTDTASATNDIQGAMEEDPELAKALVEMMGGK